MLLQLPEPLGLGPHRVGRTVTRVDGFPPHVYHEVTAGAVAASPEMRRALRRAFHAGLLVEVEGEQWGVLDYAEDCFVLIRPLGRAEGMLDEPWEPGYLAPCVN